MGKHQFIGGSFIDSFTCDGFAHELSVDPAGDASTSNCLIKITRQKLQLLPTGI
jgi:hypothetical protein